MASSNNTNTNKKGRTAEGTCVFVCVCTQMHAHVYSWVDVYVQALHVLYVIVYIQHVCVSGGDAGRK